MSGRSDRERFGDRAVLAAFVVVGAVLVVGAVVAWLTMRGSGFDPHW